MGKALYRTYRSKSFDEVIGQEHITTTLKNTLKNGDIGHAYLLTGPRGVGKTSVARILAYGVNNLEYDESGSHMDIIEIDAASNRRIDEIRSLRERVHIAPTSAKYKVYIIDEVHMLTREAFNALLKTLEEPPDHVIFILATTEAHKLPDTIVSRCIRFSFRPIPGSDVVAHLGHIAEQEKLSISPEALKLIAKYGQGSFRDSISLLDQVKGVDGQIEVRQVEQMIGIAPEQAVSSILDALSGNNPKELISALDKAREFGVTDSVLSQQIAEMLRMLLIEKKLPISIDLTMSLLGGLLEVPGSISPRSKLEILLLQTLLKDQNLAEEPPAPKKPQSIEQPKQDLPEASEPSSLKSSPNVPEIASEIEEAPLDSDLSEPAQETLPAQTHPLISGSNDSEVWESVLNVLKSRHNTLYGVARMAKADHFEDQLTLQFKFPFHYKRMEDARSKDILLGVLTELGYNNTRISISQGTEDKAIPSSDNQIVAKKNQNMPPTTITNIFGSAEMLES